MEYQDGSVVLLGDKVSLPVPDGQALARVVMLGDSREHLELDHEFMQWVNSSDVLASRSIVVEWVDPNPFVHGDPGVAPVGGYMFTVVDEWVELHSRAEA